MFVGGGGSMFLGVVLIYEVFNDFVVDLWINVDFFGGMIWDL